MLECVVPQPHSVTYFRPPVVHMVIHRTARTGPPSCTGLWTEFVDNRGGRVARMTSTLVRFVTEEGAHNELPMPAWVFGVIAMTAFVALLGVLWSFRGTAAKIRGAEHPDAGGHH